MKGMKLVSVGAGSTYTPDFAEMLIERQETLPVREWVMMDIDEERLQVVGDFTRDIIEKAGISIKLTLTTDLKEAVTDADFVITTMRVGKAQGRVLDETIPPKHGLVGQETMPPGGLAMGLRNIPVIVEVAKAIEEYAKPDAWLVNLANPGGMLTEAVHRKAGFKRAVGLCNWPVLAWSGVARGYEVERDQVFLRFVGLNHLNWAKFYVNGEAKGIEAFHKLMAGMTMTANLSPEAMSKMLPSEDLREFIGWPFAAVYDMYYYNSDEMHAGSSGFKVMWKEMAASAGEKLPPVIAKKIADANSRAEMVALIDAATIDMYRNKDIEGFRLVQATRGGASYGEAGLDVVSSIWNNTGNVQIVDYPNMGSLPDIPRDNVAQIPCYINRVGVWPLTMGDIPRHMKSFIQASKHYEILAVEAAVEGSYLKALEALVASPIVTSFEKAKNALDELLVAHKEYLPNFADAIAKLEKNERPY